MALRRGDAKGALVAADAALGLLRSIGDPQEIGVGENLRSRALAALGRTAEAVEAGERAVALHARTATARYLHVWHGELARLYASMGQDARAGEHYERSLARTENLDRLLAIDRFRLNLFREVADVFRSYAFWLAERGEERRAWEVLEQGRARELRLRLVQGGSAAVSPAETEALARLGVVQRKLREEELSRDERQQLLATAAGAEAEYERARQQAQRARPAARENVALPTFPADATVVEYALSDGRLLVLSHRAGSIRARVVAAARHRRGRAPAARIRHRCAGGGHGRARALGGGLLGPELQDVPGGRLLIVPDGVLHLVPFAALQTADGAFLVERFVLSQAPSLGVWHELRTRPLGRPSRTLAVIANTRFTGGPEVRPRLLAAAREARAVARRARDPLLLLEASEAAVARLPFDQFQALHFASHVEIDEEHPERSRIVMAVGAGADDGYLQAREIERMRLPCRLVVVSGCRSGQGRILDGEGVVGLSHALHGAGVRSLVMSLWDVTDDGAAEAMARFYELTPGGPSARRCGRPRARCAAPRGSHIPRTGPPSSSRATPINASTSDGPSGRAGRSCSRSGFRSPCSRPCSRAGAAPSACGRPRQPAGLGYSAPFRRLSNAARRQARSGARRREQVVDRVGHRAGGRPRGRADGAHLPGRAAREERARAGVVARAARHPALRRDARRGAGRPGGVREGRARAASTSWCTPWRSRNGRSSTASS